MKVPSLCYHDVIAASAWNSSGFCGAGSPGHKLDAVAFRQHMQAIEDEVMAHQTARRPGHVSELLGSSARRQGCLLTFDGGGASAITTIAPILEDFGWRGHFFISTDYIGREGFLTGAQIRELYRRGHAIGTHSRSHRGSMSSLPVQRLVEELGMSKEILSGLLRADVVTAALASGYYAPRIAEAAALVGLKALFTLEPRAQVESRGGCLVLGRYLVKRGMPARRAAKLAVGSPWQCARQWLLWNAQRLVKTAPGDVYPKVGRACLPWQIPGSGASADASTHPSNK